MVAVGTQECAYKDDPRTRRASSTGDALKMDELAKQVAPSSLPTPSVRRQPSAVPRLALARITTLTRSPSALALALAHPLSHAVISGMPPPAPQEKTLVSAGESIPKNAFLKQVQAHFGADYHCVGKGEMGEMKLIVLVHRKHKTHVSNVAVSNEATGLGHVIANKGGILVKVGGRSLTPASHTDGKRGTLVQLEVYGTSVAFTSCHLAAHEKEKYVKRRNEDCAEIMDGCRVGKGELDMASQVLQLLGTGAQLA